MSINTPVVFIIFNRLDLTQIVFNRIRQAQPKQLFVIADGPRFPEEIKKCQQARDVINQVDWNCEVNTRFLDNNIGGPYCISNGLDWVFQIVEEAIILEDDCLPDMSFFSFCDELLEYYKNNEQVMHITGNNFQIGQSRTNYSYFFSKYALCWGWATWRRAWQKFDLNLKTWPDAKKQKMLEKICFSSQEVKYWEYIFEKVYNKESVHWDYAWKYCCFYNRGLTISPNVNLVSNLGFGDHGTHTKDENSPYANLPCFEISSISHPSKMNNNNVADWFTFNFRFNDIVLPDSSNNNTDIQSKISRQVVQKLRTIKYMLPESFRLRYSQNYRKLKLQFHDIQESFKKQLPFFWNKSFPLLNNNQIFLHLGCGLVNHPSFVNIDARFYSHIHYVQPIDQLKRFPKESVDLIYACHCLEHFSFLKIPSILSEWHRVLKFGGIIRLSVPDFDLLVKVYNENYNDINSIAMALMGGQDYKYNFHMSIFNHKSLEELLKSVGFHSVQAWEPGESIETTFIDWSCRPIIYKGKAYPVSLNLEAVK